MGNVNPVVAHRAGCLKFCIRLLPFLFVVLPLISCGGSSASESNSPKQPVTSSNVGPDGGVVEVPGIVTVEFPAGAFSHETKIGAEIKAADEALMRDYEKSFPVSYAGPTYRNALIVSSPTQPLKNAVVKYRVPAEFLATMGQNYRPVLSGKFLQYGANEEELDSFGDFKQTFSAGLITAELPLELFTSRRAQSAGASQAIVVLGSLPIVSEGAPSKSSSFFLAATLTATCNGNPTSSPLAGDLTVTSPFGARIHPITGEQSGHYGVDLRADTGDGVFAVADGTIDAIEFDFNPETGRGYGRYIVLLHSDGSWSKYAHLEEGSTDNLHVGDFVSAGAVIGRADTTGGATGPHLHFEYGPQSSASRLRIDPSGCIIEPIGIVSTTVGEAAYWPYFEIPFEISLDIPEPNYVFAVSCEDNDGTGLFDYGCAAYYAGSGKISGTINMLDPRGTASVTVKITDCIGRAQTVAISESWDCCDSSDTAYYMGVIRSCIALGDTLRTTLCPVK